MEEYYVPTYRDLKEKELKIKYYGMLVEHKNFVYAIFIIHIFKHFLENAVVNSEIKNLYVDFISKLLLFITFLTCFFHFYITYMTVCNKKSKMEFGIFMLPNYFFAEWLLNIFKVFFYNHYEHDRERGLILVQYMILLIIFFMMLVIAFDGYTEKVYKSYEALKEYEAYLDKNDLKVNEKIVVTVFK